jgi:hypothetical protein
VGTVTKGNLHPIASYIKGLLLREQPFFLARDFNLGALAAGPLNLRKPLCAIARERAARPIEVRGQHPDKPMK